MRKRPGRVRARPVASRTRPGRIRIIGGQWRGRSIPVLETAALRPSPDRVRETLFNWLAPCIENADCLDLFAGTGALGFEALSRGAKSVTLIDEDPALVAQLVTTCARLGTDRAEIVRADALAWLGRTPAVFDIVFVDPPFHRGYVPRVMRLLESGWVAPGGLIYVEQERACDALETTGTWRIFRRGRTRASAYALIRCEGGNHAPPAD